MKSESKAVFTAGELAELNCSPAALQPINFVTLTRVTNDALCNWVNSVQVSSVQVNSPAVNSPFGKHVFRTFKCSSRTPVQFSLVVCCERGLRKSATSPCWNAGANDTVPILAWSVENMHSIEVLQLLSSML